MTISAKSEHLKIISMLLAIVFAASLLCSCVTPKNKEEQSPKKTQKETAHAKFPEDASKPDSSPRSEEVSPTLTDTGKSNVMISEKSKRSPQDTSGGSKKFYQGFLKKKNINAPPEKVVIDFKNVDLSDVIPLFASILKFNYMIDPDIKGVVSMALNTTMTESEIWNLFEQSLELCGAYCSERDGVVHILPFSKMPQQKQLAVGVAKPGGNAETLLYHLQTISPADAAKQIKPFMTSGGTAIEMTAQNSILLVDTMGNIPKLNELLQLLDQKPSDRLHRMVLRCNYVSASRLINELNEILPVLGFPVSSSQKSDSGAIQLIGVDRLQLIVATAANNEALDELKKWIDILDSSYAGEQEKIYIYKIVNSKASELVQALSVIFKVEGTTMASEAKSGTNSTPNYAGSTGSGAKSSTVSMPNSRNFSSTSPAISSSSTNLSRERKDSGYSSIFEIPVSIFADAINNRLIIRTTPRTYAMLSALLKSLDTVPDQVLLQVLVAEVILSDSTSLGIKYSFNENNGDVINWVQTNYAATNPAAKDKQGLSYLLQSNSSPDKNVYLNALAGLTGIKVISSPQLLVTSHSAAKISVGDKVPIITSEITDTQSSTDPNNTAVRRAIQYYDTGIILNITPHVTKGKLIEMELEQIVSEAVKTTSSTNIDSPTIQERTLKTAMSLRNGKTLIIGGLIKERYEDRIESVPGFIDVPFLRRLMSSSSRIVTRTEMLIFITANIIEETTDLEKTLQRYRDSIAVLKKVQPDIKLSDEQEVGKWFW